MAGGDCARAGTWIRRVQLRIGPAIERHGAGARRNHRHQDPSDGSQRGNAVSSQNRRSQSEREREDGVLPFDHLQRRARLAPESWDRGTHNSSISGALAIGGARRGGVRLVCVTGNYASASAKVADIGITLSTRVSLNNSPTRLLTPATTIRAPWRSQWV